MVNVSTTAFYLILCLAGFFSVPLHAAWFEASGQAVIEDGNKEIARQNATQEAIKQALLFAGASVKSVQRMTDGLLQNDELTIRSSGEVNSIEMIDEIYHDGIVTVSIRADIFAQQTQCKSSDYSKSITTSWSPIIYRDQATLGELFHLGKSLSSRLQLKFERQAQHSQIDLVNPAYISANIDSSEVITLATTNNSQYVLLNSITDLSSSQPPKNAWAIWSTPDPVRQFGLQAKLFDGYTGAIIWQHNYAVNAPWEIDRYTSIDVDSESLWQSQYGKAMQQVLNDLVTQVDEELACRPAYGRILQVQGDTLQFNIGSQHGVKKSDNLTLFQVQQFYDPQGNLYSQFRVHPTRVKVVEVFPESASAVAVDGSFLGNIQANDFVSRR